MISIIKKFLNKRIKLTTSLFVVIGFSVLLTALFVGNNIYQTKKAEAFAYDFGGRITFYNPMCILDTPSPPATPTTCAMSCPACTLFNGGACAGQQEIVFTPFGGPNFVCPPKLFPIIGAPMVGGQVMGGGASPNTPVIMAASP